MEIPLNLAKWRYQMVINLLGSSLFLGTGIALLYVYSLQNSIPESKIIIASSAFVMGVPSAIIVGHLLLIRKGTAMTFSGGRFTDHTRIFRKTKNVPISDIEAIKIVYRSRPFSGISREYRIQYFDQQLRESNEVFIADYLVSRMQLVEVANELAKQAGIEDIE